ncbi:MAG: transposase [Rhodanobacter sp.]
MNDHDHGAPPVIRDDLPKLHQLAMAAINHGARPQVGELFDLPGALDDHVSGMMKALEQNRDTLSDFMGLYPESLDYADESDDCSGIGQFALTSPNRSG